MALCREVFSSFFQRVPYTWCTTTALVSKNPDISPTEHTWDMMKREFTLSPEPATIIADLRQRVQDAWDNLSQDDIRHLYDRLHARIHACVAARGGTLCNDVTIWALLTVTSVFHLV